MAYRWNKNWASKYTAGVSGKKILVVNDFQLAIKLSSYNSVTYLTDDKEDYYDFLEMISPVNNVNFGMDDTVHLVDFKADYTKEITGMKFDLIVGNPPYEGAGKPLYLQILAALIPFAKEVVWICPTQWTKAWKDIPYTAELKRTTLNCLIEHENMPSPFEDASLFNEVAVYHFGEAEKYEIYEDLYYERFKNKSIAKSIISKLISFKSHLSDFVNSGNGDYYAVMARVRGNVLLGKPKWDWVTLFGEEQRTYPNPPKETTSKKQFKYFRFDTKKEWSNFIEATETDVSAFALYAAKISSALNPKDIALMPWLSDYTRPWTDEDIAKEIGLTKEELDYIHEEMKNFGWKCAKKIKG